MTTDYYKNKVVVGIVKRKDNKILLAKVTSSKLGEFGNLQYVFPGGRVEESETPEDALTREILEKTGYDIEIKGQISFRVHPVTGQEIYYYFCKVNLDEQKTGISSEDLDSLIWIDLHDITDYLVDLNPDVQRAIALL